LNEVGHYILYLLFGQFFGKCTKSFNFQLNYEKVYERLFTSGECIEHEYVVYTDIGALGEVGGLAWGKEAR